MFNAELTLKSIPEIGFANHFYCEDYDNYYSKRESSFELVFLESGNIEAELYGKTFTILPGSLFVLLRELPFHLYSVDNTPKSFCSVQLICDFDYELLQDDEPRKSNGIVLPFLLSPCAEAERIRRELNRVISDIAVSRAAHSHACSCLMLGILSSLDAVFRKSHTAFGKPSSILDYKMKRHIAEHIGEEISLSSVAKALEKTPGYLNSVFKEANGMTVCQYINREKAFLIAELMSGKGADFRTACENAAIFDVSYGYRLFKKHMGATPKEYMRLARVDV